MELSFVQLFSKTKDNCFGERLFAVLFVCTKQDVSSYVLREPPSVGSSRWPAEDFTMSCWRAKHNVNSGDNWWNPSAGTWGKYEVRFGADGNSFRECGKQFDQRLSSLKLRSGSRSRGSCGHNEVWRRYVYSIVKALLQDTMERLDDQSMDLAEKTLVHALKTFGDFHHNICLSKVHLVVPLAVSNSKLLLGVLSYGPQHGIMSPHSLFWRACELRETDVQKRFGSRPNNGVDWKACNIPRTWNSCQYSSHQPSSARTCKEEVAQKVKTGLRMPTVDFNSTLRCRSSKRKQLSHLEGVRKWAFSLRKVEGFSHTTGTRWMIEPDMAREKSSLGVAI